VHVKTAGSIAVIVTQRWINARSVRLFLRHGREVGGDADTHIILANVRDSDDPNGLWTLRPHEASLDC
jgi:hypothetical protein